MATPAPVASTSTKARGGVAAERIEDIEDVPQHLLHHVTRHDLDNSSIQAVRRALLQWYGAHRRHLPWRGDAPPYTDASATTATSVVGSKRGRGGATDSTSSSDGKLQTKNKKKQRRTRPQQEDKVGRAFMAAFFKAKGSNTTTATTTAVVCAPANPASSQSSITIVGTSSTNTSDPSTPDSEAPSTATSATSSCHGTVSPYGTWVSEIMCQQTRVATVIDYYQRWMARFPTVQALASSSIEDVNAMWAGLGYYRRAKYLHNGAQYVVNSCGGKLPTTVAGLLKVPGIGQYTAGAIASISYGLAAPVVDGNVIRVLSRLRAVAADPSDKKLNAWCWKLAGQLVDPTQPGLFNQAIMELGATICSPKSPSCDACPIQSHCLAAQEQRLVTAGKPVVPDHATAASPCPLCRWQRGEAQELTTSVVKYPLPKPRKVSAKAALTACVVLCTAIDGTASVLLHKRPAKGLLAGQWEFVMGRMSEEDCKWSGKNGNESVTVARTARQRAAEASLRLVPQPLLASCSSSGGGGGAGGGAGATSVTLATAKRSSCGTVRHVFSHIVHVLHVEYLHLATASAAPATQSGNFAWVPLSQLRQAGLTTWACKMLAAAVPKVLASAPKQSRHLQFLYKRAGVPGVV